MVTLLVDAEHVWKFSHFGKLDGNHIEEYDEDLIVFLHISGRVGELIAFFLIFDCFEGDIDDLFGLF